MELKKITYLIMTCLAVSECASCSSDSDAPAEFAAEVQGQYVGYSAVASAYFSNRYSLDQEVSVRKLDGNTVSVSYISSSLGNFTIPEATVVKTGNTYSISGKGTTEMGMGDNTKSYACTVSGSVSADGIVTCEFNVPSVMGGMTVSFHEGVAPED